VAAAMMALLVAIATGGVYVGSAVVTRHRAQAAADLAALARAMHTAVTGCVVEDLDVIVTVDAPVSLGRMGVDRARATARAGPADTGG